MFCFNQESNKVAQGLVKSSIGQRTGQKSAEWITKSTLTDFVKFLLTNEWLLIMVYYFPAISSFSIR